MNEPWWDDNLYDDEPAPDCPACGGLQTGGELGQLGNLYWYRCVNCGMDFNKEANE